jgi:uncharacterized protein YjiS (DUF1127 family)
MKHHQHIPKSKGHIMLRTSIKSLSAMPRLTATPFQMLVRMNQKHRELETLRKLDARTMKDIGMSEARRVKELQNW